jgi:transcriptional regulator with XRE-family HTH domain
MVKKEGNFMDIEYLKKVKKEKRMTLQQISDLSCIPKRTVDGIFSGKTKNPRIDTMQAIERALGLEEQKTPPVQELTEDEQEIFTIISQLTDEEIQEARAILQYILNKRA